MKRCFAFCGTPPIGVSFLSITCSRSCWLPFSFVLSVFSWQISSIICYYECCRDCNTSMKMLALSMGILGYGWGSAPVLLTPFVWLGCYWWGFVGLDSASEGTTLMFRVVLDFEGIYLQGFLSLSASQLPSGVSDLNVVGLFVMLSWAVSCRIGPKYSRLGSWDRSNCNSLWSSLCTNYASFARNLVHKPMADKATSDESWQANMIIIIIIIIKESTFAFRQSK